MTLRGLCFSLVHPVYIFGFLVPSKCWSDELPYTYQAAKDVVLAEKPVISDDSNQLDSSLLDELLANIATLSCVYHKPPEAFITRVRTVQRTEEEEFPDGIEGGYPESSSTLVVDSAAPPPAKPPTTLPSSPDPVPDLLDLIGLDGGDDNAIVSVDQPATPAG